MEHQSVSRLKRCLRPFQHDRQRGNEHQPVAGKRRAGRHDVHIKPEPARRLIPAKGQLVGAVVGALRLDFGDPLRLVVVHKRHRRLFRRGQRAHRRQLSAHRFRFLPAGGKLAHAGKVQPRMELLLGERRLAPAEIADHISPVRDGFPRPEPHHAPLRHGVPRRPVHRARLLLHDPEPPAAHAPVKVVVKWRDVGMRGFGVSAALGFGKREAFHKADGVGIPGCEIQLLGRLPVVELVEEAHEVVRDEASRRVRMFCHCWASKAGTCSEWKRGMSRRAAGFASVTVRWGSAASSKEPSSMDQNTLPQASLSWSGDW